MYYIGIDGGATKTTFALANENGEVLRVIKKSSSNPFDIGIEKACQILDEGIKEISKGIEYKDLNIFAGLSGGNSGNSKQEIYNHFSKYGFNSFNNGSDLENIIEVGITTKNGIAVIMGTGSSAFIKVGNELRRMDGFGYLFSHGGCGYDIGNQGIRSALMSEDGSGDKTIIQDLVLEKTRHRTVLEDLKYFYDIGKSGIASFSPIVFDAFKKGDKVAIRILDKNMRHVANLIVKGSNLLDDEQVEVILVGGLTNEIEILMPLIEKHIKEFEKQKKYNIRVFKEDVVKGALLKSGLKVKEIKYVKD